MIGTRKKRAPRSLYVLLDQHGNYDSGDIFESLEAAATEQTYALEVYAEKLTVRRYAITPKAKSR